VWIVESLRRLDLIGANDLPAATPLSGGVSSDIWRVDVGGERLCVKRALSRLKVAADWRVPVERNHYEAEWIRVAADRLPGCVPVLLGEDCSAGLFVMEYLDPSRNPGWKSVLRGGKADSTFAAHVGRAIAAIHGATAGDGEVERRFNTDRMFHDLRIDPYLLASARRRPDLAGPLTELADRTAATRKALVHGDVSPKNILVGEHGPIFIDAECAWYGDPAFDLAFCLNHLLLKCLWVPPHSDAYLQCFRALANAYLECVDWEPVEEMEPRTATLLPGLLLARVDGKSPAEYLTTDEQKDRVRRAARALLLEPPDSLDAVLRRWREESQQ